MKIIKSASTTENPLDSQYNSLNCPLQPMEPTDQMYKVSCADISPFEERFWNVLHYLWYLSDC